MLGQCRLPAVQQRWRGDAWCQAKRIRQTARASLAQQRGAATGAKADKSCANVPYRTETGKPGSTIAASLAAYLSLYLALLLAYVAVVKRLAEQPAAEYGSAAVARPVLNAGSRA